jgi:segregation and condensation protein A
MAEYKVKFEVFEGPLDLLLYLIKKEEVDIYEVNLTKLATQFIEYIDMMREFDLEVAGEFLVMASTLMYIKSRELLPVDLQAQVELEDEDDTDPRWELIRQLVEYKKFKDAAVRLQVLETAQENVFPRVPIKPEIEPDTKQRLNVSVFDLLNAVNTILKRFASRDTSRDIFEDKWTVSEKIEQLRGVLASRERVTFSELFADATSRSEVICTFLALLELIRLKQLVCRQSDAFEEIEIGRAPVPATASEPVAAESSPTDATVNPASS